MDVINKIAAMSPPTSKKEAQTAIASPLASRLLRFVNLVDKHGPNFRYL